LSIAVHGCEFCDCATACGACNAAPAATATIAIAANDPSFLELIRTSYPPAALGQWWPQAPIAIKSSGVSQRSCRGRRTARGEVYRERRQPMVAGVVAGRERRAQAGRAVPAGGGPQPEGASIARRQRVGDGREIPGARQIQFV